MKRGFLTMVSVLALALVLVIPARGAQQGYVADEAGILSQEERQELEQQAREISEAYGVGTYIVTLEDYRDYTGGSIYDAADEIYSGWGPAQSGDAIMLILSMAERDYLLIAYGDTAQYAFNDGGREYLDDYFLDDFGYDAWYAGFADYLTWSADYLENAKNGTPYSDDHIPMDSGEQAMFTVFKIAIVLLVPLVAAGIYVLILTAQMKSVARAVEASTYMSGDLKLTRDFDRYTHTTETRRKIEKQSSGGSSGRSSGGGAGTSGKF